jgi:hypothetical protein
VKPNLWTILIPTIGQREHLLLRLLDVLLPQLEPYAGEVRVLAWRNNGSPALGEIRDALVRDAGSEYVSFIDDDDLVPEYYVAEVVHALRGRPHHVGFQLEYTTDDGNPEVVDHSLRHGRWHSGKDGTLLRDFTHIDPIRRDIAMRGTFVVRRPGRAEDRFWVKQVRQFLASEAYVPRIMYHYLWRSDTSVWQNPAGITPKAGRPAVASPHFSWHPRSDP